ncbi:MAG: hypothetical protein ABI402_09040 [Ferruginibacter sp.]
MYNNQISAFEYVSILVSIILGLGITQILASFSDLLYDYKKIRFYWPHTCWVVFILFLHIQDWFIIYQLKDKATWHLPELFFILLYPISLFCVAKMLLSANKKEERFDMKLFYNRHFPLIFFMVAVAIFISVLFNLFILKINVLTQITLAIFLIAMIYASIKNYTNEIFHKALAIAIISGSLLSIILNENSWVIK